MKEASKDKTVSVRYWSVDAEQNVPIREMYIGGGGGGAGFGCGEIVFVKSIDSGLGFNC